MMTSQQHSHRRRPQPPVVLLSGLNRDEIQPMLELSRQWGWELRGTWLALPEWDVDRPLAGALVKDLPAAPLARRLREAGVPTVRFGSLPHPDDDVLPAVLPDLAASGRLAADHFASRAFKEVAFAGHDPEDTAAAMHPAYLAFRQRATERGMRCCLFTLKAGDRLNEPDREARRMRDLDNWLKQLPKPVGIYCFNDIMAEKVGLACAQLGIMVPEEVAILGHGNSLQCEITPVRLSSVDPGLSERVHAAMRLLRGLMAGEAAPPTPVFVRPAGIVERQSTHVLAVADPAVARALRFIWNHFDDAQLTIEEIAAQAGVCRRTLERKFRGSLRRGIGAELKRKRLEQCRHLLTSTNLSLAKIAPSAGFASVTYLHKAFTQTFGMTPRQFRVKT